MNALPRHIRPAPGSAEEAVRRYVGAVRRDIEPDPLFRRRLRSTVMNRFVAEREGALDVASAGSPRMGRLGRACLYASLATVLSVGGVMAASDAAIPGDLLYSLKRTLEQLRLQVAPAHLRDELATYALAERMDELGRLLEAGSVAGVAELAAAIRAEYDQLASTGEGKVVADERLAAQLARLEAALDRAPVRARLAVERAMSGALGFETHPAAPGSSNAGEGPATPSQGGGGRQGGAENLNGGAEHEPPGQVEQAGPGDPDPKPDRTTRPARTPKPSPTARPELP